jgi:peptidoglycan hydrolase-like protein with peptidoglycan-binding domain
MMDVVIGPGARGEHVARVQQALTDAGFDPLEIDAEYGTHTAAAVRAYQQAHGLNATGCVDLATWQALLKIAPPSISERCLALTAAFEEHGYSLVQGNWDGAGLTWGIIGFTLASGSLQEVLLKVHNSTPELITAAFGACAGELCRVLRAGRNEQMKFADAISDGSSVIEPWHSAFAKLGQFPVVQQAQRDIAQERYFAPALGSARWLGLKAELGLALCFDIQVQDGGISPAVRSVIRREAAQRRPVDEVDVRTIVAEAIAGAAQQIFRDDVRSRKLTLARGEGVVHGSHFVLENWGLAERPAPELLRSEAVSG